MEKKYLLGVFLDEHEMIHAARELKSRHVPIYDFYTPFPVHGLDQLLDIKRTRLPYVTFVAGAVGLAVALLFQYWVSVVDWPINVGGKAFNSFAAFIPVAFEVTILFGAFITVFAFLFRNRLSPMIHNVVMHPGASQDKFVIALELIDSSIDVHTIGQSLRENGAVEVEIKEVNV